MNTNQLYDMIYKRRSVRKYSTEPISDEMLGLIEAAFAAVRPLYPEIRVRLRIVSRANVRSLMPWMPPYAVAIYSEDADGSLENAGFILEQLDLYIQSLGIGSCWVGLGRVKDEPVTEDGLKFVMLLAIGNTSVPEREGISDFSRKELSDISDTADERLIPALLAPSSVNSQPWFFERCEEGYNVYKRNLVRTAGLSRMNMIDVGIALSHLYVSYPDSFGASRRDTPPERKNMTYVCTVCM